MYTVFAAKKTVDGDDDFFFKSEDLFGAFRTDAGVCLNINFERQSSCHS